VVQEDNSFSEGLFATDLGGTMTHLNINGSSYDDSNPSQRRKPYHSELSPLDNSQVSPSSPPASF